MTHSTRIGLMAFIAMLTLLSAAHATTVNLTPTQDTFIQGNAATTNFGGNTTFSLEGESTRLKRPLLLFDLSSVPAVAVVLSATLTLEKVSGDDVADSISVFACSRSWVEGNGSAGSGATWNTYNGTNNWTTAGGDFDATASATAGITGATGPKTWDLTSLVQAWVNNTHANHGVLLKRKPEAGGNQPLHDFVSREGTTAPKLTIIYGVPSVAVSNGTFAYGVQPLNTWSSTQLSVITNDGLITENVLGRISQFTDGSNAWGISSTANGADVIRAQWSTTSSSGPWTDIAEYGVDFMIASGVTSGSTVSLWFRIQTPTSTPSLNEHASTLTVTAQ